MPSMLFLSSLYACLDASTNSSAWRFGVAVCCILISDQFVHGRDCHTSPTQTRQKSGEMSHHVGNERVTSVGWFSMSMCSLSDQMYFLGDQNCSLLP